MLKKASKKRLCIDIKNHALYFSVGSFDGTTVNVDKLFKKELNFSALLDNKLADEQQLADVIKETLKQHNVKVSDCYMYISGGDLIRKTLIVPYVEDPSDFDELVHTEISQVLPMDLDNFIIKYKYVSEDESSGFKRITLNCVIINKEQVNSYRNLIKLAGLKPIALDVESSALENLVKYIIMSNSDDTSLYEKEIKNSVIAFIDVNLTNCSVNIFKGGKIDFTRIVKTPELNKDVIEVLLKNDKDNSFTFEGLDASIVFETLNDILSEINLVLKYYMSRDRNVTIDELFLYGTVAVYDGIDTYSQDILQLSVNSISSIEGVVDADKFDDNISIYINTIGGLIRW